MRRRIAIRLGSGRHCGLPYRPRDRRRLRESFTAERPLTRRFASRVLTAATRGLQRLEQTVEEAQLVTRYFRGLLEFRPRPDDIWVATYPRSGTTWVQFLLYQLTTDGDLGFHHLTDVSPWFERSLARGTCRAADFDAVPSPRVFKSHLTPGWLPAGGRVVYVERSPEDVLVSYYHFYRSHLRFQGTFDEFYGRFVAGDLQYGRWSDHVAEWTHSAATRSVLRLTFEGLRDDPERTVRRLCRFLDLEPGAAVVGRALERTRFDFMKMHEEKFDHVTALLRERGLQQNAFLRKGRGGEGRTLLGNGQRGALEQSRHRAPLRRGLRADLARFLH